MTIIVIKQSQNLTFGCQIFPVSLLLSEVISCSFVWNMLLCFLILLDPLCWILYIRGNNSLSQSWSSGLLQEVTLIVQSCPGSWLPHKHFWESKQPISFFHCSQGLRVCQDLSLSQREDLSQNLNADWLEAGPTSSSFQSMQVDYF